MRFANPFRRRCRWAHRTPSCSHAPPRPAQGEFQFDLVIANGENAAAGRGITPSVADELLRAGVDIITSGNHIWDQKEIIPYLDSAAPILRPLNFPSGVPGRGMLQEGAVTVINLQGRVFMTQH